MWSQFIAIFNYAIQQNNRNSKSSWDMLKNRVSNLQIHWIFSGHTERFVTGPTNRFIQFFQFYLQTYPVCYQSNLLLSNLFPVKLTDLSNLFQSYLEIYPICSKSNLQIYAICSQSNLQICPICSLWGNCIERVGLFQKTILLN